MRSTGSLIRFNSFLFFSILFLFIRCSGHNQDGNFAFLGPKTPYSSPFESKKIILSPESFDGNVEEDSSAKTIKALPIVVFVDNTCVDKHCKENANDSFNCFFSKHAEKIASQEKQFYSFSLPNPMTQDQLDDYLGSKSCILGVANQTQYKLTGFNDTYFNSNQKSYLNSVNFEDSLSIFTSENLSPVKVAVIDSGVGTHPDLGGANETPGIVSRIDLRSNSSKSNPECATATYTNENPNNNHGTFVAGIISAKQNNSSGIAGLASNSQIFSIAIGDCKGRMSSSEVANALFYSLQLGAEVINMSLGGGTADDPAVRSAIVSLLNTKTVLIASAGNSFEDLRTKREYPAVYSQQYPGFLTVAWGTSDGGIQLGNQTTYGSNYSPDHVEILAPGTTIASTVSFQGEYPSLGEGIGSGSGSSFSTPIITSAATLAIGYLKKNGIEYDERLIEYLLLEKGSNKKSELASYVKDGNVIDFSKLGLALKYLKDTGNTPQPITTTNQNISYNSSLDQPTIQFTANWNLDLTHLGARIGVFDLTPGCNYSAPCLIQDFELSGNSGSKNFTLTRDEIISVQASETDPNNIPIAVGIFYKIPKGNGTGYESNYGLDAIIRLNLRDFDSSTATSQLLGEVTNFRTDMAYFYIQGWTCLEGSNKALKVEVIRANGGPIATDFSYSVKAPNFKPKNLFNSAISIVTPLGVLQSAGMILHDQTNYPAGLEANATVINRCKTLTTSQGFEFGVPLADIKNNSWEGESFSVRVTHPNEASNKMLIKDKNLNSSFKFPDVNFQPTVAANTSLNRSGENVSLSGNICSNSPGPIHMEVSINAKNLLLRLEKMTSFPDVTNYKDPERNLPYLVSDPSEPERQKFREYDYRSFCGPDPLQFQSTDLELTEAELSRHIRLYPNFWPNSELNFWELANCFSNIVSKGFREVGTGALLTGVKGENFFLKRDGELILSSISGVLTDRSGISFDTRYNFSETGIPNLHTWNPDDARYPNLSPQRFKEVMVTVNKNNSYEDQIVHYALGKINSNATYSFGFNSQKTIGEYLSRTYGVHSVLVEAKTFEMPLDPNSQVLLFESLTNPQRGTSSNCSFQFNYQKQIQNLSKYNPNIIWLQYAFLKNNDNLVLPEMEQDLAKAIQEVPLNIRFFQDGVLILNQVSNFGTDVTNFPVLGRGN